MGRTGSSPGPPVHPVTAVVPVRLSSLSRLSCPRVGRRKEHRHGKNSAGSGSGTAPFCQQLFPDPSPVLARNRVDIFNHLLANNPPSRLYASCGPLSSGPSSVPGGSGTGGVWVSCPAVRMQEVMMMMMVIHPSVSRSPSGVGKACGKEGWALAPNHRGKPSRSGLSMGLQRGSRSPPSRPPATATGTAVLAPLGKAAAEVQPGGSPGREGPGERQGSSCGGVKNHFKKNKSSMESPLGSAASPLRDRAPPRLVPQFPLPLAARLAAGGHRHA